MVEDTLVVEAILREIGRAQRWQTIDLAWNALLTVRRMADDIRNECEMLKGSEHSNTEG